MCAVTVIAASLAAATPAGVDEAAVSAERRAVLERRFERMDRNGDGLIAVNEAPRVARPRCGSGEKRQPDAFGWLGAFDADGDRRVDLREFVAGSIRKTGRQVTAAAE